MKCAGRDEDFFAHHSGDDFSEKFHFKFSFEE